MLHGAWHAPQQPSHAAVPSPLVPPQALSAILNLKLDTDDAPGSAWVSLFSVVVIMA